MKLYGLGILAITVFYFYDSYTEYRKEIIDYINQQTPPMYSVNNPKKITVTSAPARRRKSRDDETELIHNDDFDYIPEYFELDNTEKLRLFDLTCMPDSFGYSKEQGEKIFPYHGYPKCSVVNNQTDTYMHIDREKNLLYMNCPDGKNGKYITGPLDKKKIAKSNEINDK